MEVEPIAVCEEEVPLNVAVVPTCVFCISISPNINTPTLINIAENEGRQDIVDKINFVLFENVSFLKILFIFSTKIIFRLQRNLMKISIN